MAGGLWMSGARSALLAVSGVLALGVTSAQAADLGGNCCADLEERIAELEATSARKGNRKVSLKIYGQVNQAIGWWDDGIETNVYNFTNDTSRTRFGFKGKAKISSDLFAEYRIEVGVRAAGQQGLSATNVVGNSGLDLRHAYWALGSKTYGKVSVGQTSMAHDGIKQNQTARIGHFANNDIFDFPSDFLINSTAGASLGRWDSNIQNREPGEGSRGNLVRYDTPTLAGFKASAHWGEDDIWGVALKYAGKVGAFKVKAGIGYGEITLRDEECTESAAATVKTRCQEYGMSASAMHKPTGLFLTGAYGVRMDEQRESFGGSDENTHWLVQGGIEQKWNHLGPTTIFGGYQDREAGRNTAGDNAFDVEMFEVGLNQYLSAAAMDLYLHYKHYEADVTTPAGAAIDAHDFQTVIGGARIKF
jgi:predicted porin